MQLQASVKFPRFNRMKIGCLLGAGARGTRNEGWITTVVTRMLPAEMSEFAGEYARVAKSRSVDESDCHAYECKKCFGV